jgi:hypothetical protein
MPRVSAGNRSLNPILAVKIRIPSRANPGPFTPSLPEVSDRLLRWSVVRVMM